MECRTPFKIQYATVKDIKTGKQSVLKRGFVDLHNENTKTPLLRLLRGASLEELQFSRRDFTYLDAA